VKPNWLVIGGLGVGALVLFLAMKQNNSSQDNSSGIVPTTDQFPTTNLGTPQNTNDSLVGFVDPVTGIQWVLHSGDVLLSNGQLVNSGTSWSATLPTGMLPPNYSPGGAFIIPSLFPSPTSVTGSNA